MEASVLEAYYRVELLYAKTLEVLHADDDGAPGEFDSKALKVADLLLTVAQVDRILSGPSADAATTSDDAQVLGVSSAQLHRTFGLTDASVASFRREPAQNALVPRVEEKLREVCSDLCDVVLPELRDRARLSPPTSTTASSAFIAPTISRQAMEIPTLLLELKTRHSRKAAAVESLKRQLHAQLRHDLENIKALIVSVQQLLVSYKQRDAPRFLESKMQWLAAYSRAIATRTRVVTKQIVLETYPREQVGVLRGVKFGLEERHRHALQEKEQLLAKLHLYRNMDAEYQAIVREYGHLQEGIKEKRAWIQSLDV